MMSLPLVVLLGGIALAFLVRERWLRPHICAITVVLASSLEGVGRLRLLVPELVAPRYWDIAMGGCVLVALGAYRRQRRRGLVARQPPLLVAAALATGVSLARGTLGFSLQQSLAQARSFTLFLVLAGLIWTSTKPQRLQPALIWTGVLLAGYTMFHVASRGLASAQDVNVVGGVAFTRRALPAAQALLILQAGGLLLLYSSTRLSRFARIAAVGLCSGAVLVLQHRSVWLAGVVGALVVTSQVRTTRNRMRILSVAVGGLVLSGLFLLGPTTSLRENLSSSVEGVTDTSSGTLGDRTSGWQVLLEDEFSRASTLDKLVGTPWGNSFDRTVSGRAVTYSPHSQYVTLALRTGLLGLTAWVVLLLAPLVRTMAPSRRRRTSDQSRSVIVWIVATQVTYGFAYSLPAEQGVVLGIALALSFRDRRPVDVKRSTMPRNYASEPGLAEA